MSDTANPVWDVYDLLRTTRLNVKDYSAVLARLERYNLSIEIFLAITTSTTIAAYFLRTSVGSTVWWIVGMVSALVSIVKPFLSFPKMIKDYEVTLGGYRALFYDLQEIRVAIAKTGRRLCNAGRSE